MSNHQFAHPPIITTKRLWTPQTESQSSSSTRHHRQASRVHPHHHTPNRYDIRQGVGAPASSKLGIPSNHPRRGVLAVTLAHHSFVAIPLTDAASLVWLGAPPAKQTNGTPDPDSDFSFAPFSTNIVIQLLRGRTGYLSTSSCPSQRKVNPRTRAPLFASTLALPDTTGSRDDFRAALPRNFTASPYPSHAPRSSVHAASSFIGHWLSYCAKDDDRTTTSCCQFPHYENPPPVCR